MAYIVDTKISSGASGSTTVKLPAHLENDVVFVFWNSLNPGTITGPGGSWQETTIANPGAADSKAYFQRVGGSSLADPVITNTTTSRQPGAMSAVVRGADVSTATSCVDDEDSVGSSSALTLTTSAMTLSGTSSLILLFGSGERGDEVPVLASGSGIEVLYFAPGDDANMFLAYNYATGSASDTHTIYQLNTDSEGMALAAIAIKDDGNYVNKGYVSTSNAAELVFLNVGNHVHTITEEDVTNVGFTPQISSITHAISGITKNTIDDSTSLGSSGPLHRIDTHAQYGITIIFNTGQGESTDLILTKGMTFATAIDLSGQILAFSGLTLSKFTESIDNLGRLIGFSDGTNASVFLFDGSDALVTSQNGLTAFLLETAPSGSPTTLTGYEIDTFGAGNLDWSAIETIFVGASSTNSTGIEYHTGPMYKLKTFPMLGGTETFPLSFDDVVKASTAGALNVATAQSGQTTGQFYLMGNVTIGDGVEDVYWESKNQSVEFPRSYNYSEKSLQCQISAGALSLTINAASVDSVISPITTTINFGNFHNFVEHADTFDGDIYDYTNLTLLNSSTTLQGSKTNIDRSGAIWSGGKQITHNAPTTASTARVFKDTVVSNVAVGETAAIEAITTQEQFKNAVTGATFKNNTNAPAILITGNQTGTWADDPGLTVSGNTFDIKYTGTTDFSIPSSVSLTVQNTEAEAAGNTGLTIVLPANTLSINSDLSALIRYFVDDEQTVADSDTNTTLGYDYANTNPIDIEVLLQGYVLVNRQNVTPVNGPFDIELDPDEAYNSGHALNIDTEYAYVRGTKVLTFNSDQQARNVYSSLSDEIRLDSAYFNTKLLMTAIGPTRFDLTVGMTVADMQYWKGAGSQVYNALDAVNPTEKWCFVKSGGNITGSTTHFRQTDSGASTALTLTNNVVDEAFQYYRDDNHDGDTSDTDEYNYNDYMLIKSFLAGSKQSRVDVLVSQGISEIESYQYAVSLANASHGYSGTDPGISAQITMVAGDTFGGKVFAYEIIDGGTNSGSDIADQLNYDAAANPNTVIPGGTGLRYFEMPDGIIYNATGQETERGYKEGTTPALVGFYVSRSSADHPDFTQFQADDGTYYIPAVNSNISGSNLENTAGGTVERRMQIINSTAKAASAWQASTAYSVGDVRLRSTGAGTEQIGGLFIRCTTPGTSNDTEPTWNTTLANTTADTNGSGDGDVVWTIYGIVYYDDDPAATGYAATYIDGQEFASSESFEVRFAEEDPETRFVFGSVSGITSSSGFSFAMSVEVVSPYAEWQSGGSFYGTQQDSTYSPNFDYDYIVLDTNTNYYGAGAGVYYCYILTTSQGMYEFWGGVTIVDAGSIRINNGTVNLYFDETNGFVRQLDNVRIWRVDGARPALDPTTGGSGIEIKWEVPVQVIEINTGSAVNQATVQSALTAQGYTSGRAPELDKINAVKVKTDDMTYTIGNQLDVNVQSVNDVLLAGDGDATPMGPT